MIPAQPGRVVLVWRHIIFSEEETEDIAVNTYSIANTNQCLHHKHRVAPVFEKLN